MDANTQARLWTPAGWQGGADTDTAIRHVPGIANLHSHAFQRAMAGLAERRGGEGDSFWTWRETLYRFAARLDPDSLHAVASQAFVEMLEAGYTTVCEFHYLHHAPDGRPYADPAAMSRALIKAARDTGIRLLLLPVLYMRGGFDGRALDARQRRFAFDVDGYLRLLQVLAENEDQTLRIGCALHSLRAVVADAMQQLLAVSAQMPVHIHIAEQTAEVDDCMEATGARPVQWLLDHADVCARWTLVHATHLDAGETAALARSGATVAICPTTEANLGDGLFPLRAFMDAGGAFGIGSDSNISVSPVEELRWLEYGQRLITQRRNIAAGERTPSVGETLLRAVQSSARAATGGLHSQADVLMLDTEAPQFAGSRDADALDRWIFSGNRPLVSQVHVDGRCLVRDGRHLQADAVRSRYREALRGLLAD